MSETSLSGLDPQQLRELLSVAKEPDSLGSAEKGVSSGMSPRLGSWIDQYKLIECLGEGGMAIVYLAEQEYPVHRKVAIKIIKPGMNSAKVIARFEAERQTLTYLNHPNIAQINDAGTTKDGLPYFVMVHVKGLPITEYCDNHKLTIKQRLNLFRQVCLAVNHAHQKGIIHRDIKPSNILVSTQDDQAVPKIIDFGIAKAIDQPLSERTLVTEDSQLLGTPEYMSPEQADMATANIDTRTDVYSLGVLLYVLLTGVLPFEHEKLRDSGIENIRKVIRETDPNTPSTRLIRLGEKAEAIAQNRRTEIHTLAKYLRKELEWIPLKAMRKERSERYQSASELAEDIENYLNGAALTAGPPSTIYRLKKIARRNRSLITGIAAVIAVLIAGTIVSTTFAFRAERQAKNSQAISDFLINDLLASVQVVGEKKREVTIESLLDVASEALEDKFAREPLIEASIRSAMGDTYYKIGNYEAAQSNKKRAVELRTECLGTNDFQTLQWMMWLGWYYMADSKYAEAEPILEETVDGMKRILRDVDWDLLEATSRLAWVYYNQGRFDEAEKLQAGALDVVQRKLGPEHTYAPNHMEGLAFVYWEQGDREKALELIKRALEISMRDDWNPAEEAAIRKSLAWMYTELGRFNEAEDVYLRDIGLKRLMDSGEDNINFLKAVGRLATIYRKWKRYDEAEQWLVQAEEIARRVFGDDHKITDTIVNDLITLYEAWGKPDKANEWRAKLPKGSH